MLVEFIECMTSRDNVEATVGTIARLYRGPRCDHLVGRPKGEIIKILMRWMSMDDVVEFSIGLETLITINHIKRIWTISVRDSYKLEPYPASGGFAINMLCIAIIFGPVKHSTISNNLSCSKYSLKT